MIPSGQINRRLRDIWPQLAVSSGVLLAPPLLMAGWYFSSLQPHGAAQAAAVSADSRTSPMFVRPDVSPGTSFTVASAEQRPFVVELPQPVKPQPDIVPIAAVLSIGRSDGTPAGTPEGSPDAPRGSARNEPHNGHGGRRQRTLSDVFTFLRVNGR
jgi:hypothetical protein